MSAAVLPAATKAGKDAVLAAAVDKAREAAEQEAESGQVGEHLGFVLEDERLGTHYFAALAPGYRGWHWAVTVARPARARTATICETGLLPGPDALLAKAWVPWAERLRPGDLGATDRLAFDADDPRLERGFVATGDEETDRLAILELGLGRDRVATRETLDAAATRWYEGAEGPDTVGTRAAGADCASCGFIVPLSGHLGTLFGVCVNEWSPDDGKVVALDHGCGAHSQTDQVDVPHEWQQSAPVIDEFDLEVLPAAPTVEDAAVAAGDTADVDGVTPKDGEAAGSENASGPEAADVDVPAVEPESETAAAIADADPVQQPGATEETPAVEAQAEVESAEAAPEAPEDVEALTVLDALAEAAEGEPGVGDE